MKKHFLMLASWSMLMLGTASFVSCDDDDDDNQPSTTNVVEKYKDQKGASIDGNDVVYKQTDSQITVYHFSGDKIESVTTYTDFKNKIAAEAAYDEAKKEKDVDVKLDGTVLVVTVKDNKDFEEMNKQQFCDLLNGKKPNGGNNSDNGDNNPENNSDNGGNSDNGDLPLVDPNLNNGGIPGNDDNTEINQSGIVGSWILNTKESVSKEDGEIDDEYDDMLGSSITFNADGTVTSDDDMSGKYSLNGNDLTIVYTEDGETVTLKKGAQPLDEEFISEIKEGLEFSEDLPAGVMDMFIKAFVVNVDEFSAVVNGNKLTINYVWRMTLDKSQLGFYASMVTDDMIEMYSKTVENKMVFDRK